MDRSLRLVLAAALFGILTSVFASCGFPIYGGFGSGTGGGGGTTTATTGTTTVTGTGGVPPTGCSSNADCASQAYKNCDTTTKQCVQCLQASDCPAGTYCSATEMCQTGCMTNADCQTGDGGSTLTCNTATNTCQGCTMDSDCEPGTVCETSSTNCVPGCTADQACPSGRTCCSMQCVDLQADTNHCGGCATNCAPANAAGMCVDGSCAIGTCNTGFQDCNKMPNDGCEVATGTDPKNCGSCANVCATPNNATPGCMGGMCSLGACSTGFANCDGLPANGCETNTQTSPQNCGACGNLCMLANATPGCAVGSCAIAACNTGFADCDESPGDGCEVNTGSDPSNCGSCAHVCSVPNATAACAGGMCAVGMCAIPFADCNLMASDGCEVNTHTDPNNCGACATVCNLPNATSGCSNGACTVLSCNAGYADCDGNAANGCEVDLNTSAANCGACGAACSTNNDTPTCSSGKCSVVCTTGFANCDGNVANGCETNTTNNVNNCASCGHVCPVAGGTPACTNSVCGVSSCQAGYGNCDGNPSGCDNNLNTDPNNCGGCGLACFVANGTAGCTAGHCVVASCNAGFADCDGNAANGCEVNLKTNANCGMCGAVCALANATSSCSTGTCVLTACTGTFANCDGNAANGCEVDTSNNLSDCGSCGNVCSTVHDSPSCSGGSCSIACAAGYGNCDANAANGCETATTNNVNACGSCANVCSVLNGTPLCSGTTCAIGSCTAPFKDCDGMYANGCETNTGTSMTSCGTCGNACTNANGTTSCTGGVCVPVCATGYGNCDGNSANGCEANLNTDVNNCGGCGTKCNMAHANTACSTGTCVITSCLAGFADCDLNPANGCETPLNTLTNCGGCGIACTNANGTTSCAANACAPVCSAGYGNCDGNNNNGCEAKLNTDTNCGACGTACTLPNAAATCSTGSCAIAACNSGWGNCDGNAANGCETNTNTSNANCGGCGMACAGLTVCSNGMCVSSCSAGTANCDGIPADGCNVNTTTDDKHCGTCTNVCPVTETCVSSICTSCTAGTEDCDHLSSNGCETTIATDPNNCNGCGNVCAGATNAVGSCAAGACGIACDTGFANCDGSKANGCECAGNICCSGACEPAHFNGLGQSYDDCSPLGTPGTSSTYTHNMAMEARNAWTGVSTGDGDCYCNNGSTVNCTYRMTATSCAVWEFVNKTESGYPEAYAGYVYLNTGNNNCYCPSNSDPTWE